MFWSFEDFFKEALISQPLYGILSIFRKENKISIVKMYNTLKSIAMYKHIEHRMTEHKTAH